MCVAVVLRGQSILLGQAVEVGHGGVADDAGITVVFFDDHNHMGERRLVGGDGSLDGGRAAAYAGSSSASESEGGDEAEGEQRKDCGGAGGVGAGGCPWSFMAEKGLRGRPAAMSCLCLRGFALAGAGLF